MPGRERYLLRTRSQIEAFRENNRDAIRQNAGAFRKWVRGLPFMEWIPLQLRPEDEELVIGVLCLLYIDGFVRITFSDDMRSIRNEPLTDEENLAWMKATGWHGPGIDRPNNDTK